MTHLSPAFSELASMGEMTDNMVVLTDPQGYIVWVNQAFSRTCGYPLEELLGKKPGRVLQGPGSDSATVRALHDAVRSAAGCECEMVNYRHSGEPYWVHISLGPVFSDGVLEGFLAVEQELTPTLS